MHITANYFVISQLKTVMKQAKTKIYYSPALLLLNDNADLIIP